MNTVKYIIHNALIINERKRFNGDILINGDKIEKIISPPPNDLSYYKDYTLIEADGKLLIPGVIDDQVHFREPGMEYKGDIYSESRAAVAGGITSFMEMPNTKPPAVTIEELEKKYDAAAQKSLANYSFYMGTTNDNINEVLKADPKNVCGIKVFMGSSTGNLLVDSDEALNNIFEKAQMLVAVHCEDDPTIHRNFAYYKKKFGNEGTAELHPLIRSSEACYISSSKAVKLAKKYGTRLHLLHLSTADEMKLLQNDIPLPEKKITAEVCIHHLWFSDEDYKNKGNFIKWNPAIKSGSDRKALRNALKTGKIDVVATDHAPHTITEKEKPYFEAPSGGPMVQHSLVSMLQLVKKGVFTIEETVEKMCHNPATLFNIDKRGFIREGYYADLVLVDMNNGFTVSKDNILYKCGWSPMEGLHFDSKVEMTFVNGNIVYKNGTVYDEIKGKRLIFDR